MKNILLVGAGAIGTYFGGRLAQSGKCNVTVAARSEFDYVKQNGYQIQSIAGDFVWRPAVVKSAAEYAENADYILVCTKVLPEIDVVDMIRAAVKPHTVIALIQNGLDGEVAIHQAFPDNQLISIAAYIGVSRIECGKISHAGGGRLIGGVYPVAAPSAALRELADWFATAQVPFEITADIELKRWQKLLWNVPFNPISVLSGGMDTKQMVSDEKLYQLAWRIMKELQTAARCYQRELPDALLEYNMQYTKDFPAYKTSMLLDFEHKRPLEVEAIVGSVLRRAAQKKLVLPYIETVYALLSAQNQQNLQDKN